VTSADRPDDAPRARRSRRVVRPAGTVGGDEANLLSTHPAAPTDPVLSSGQVAPPAEPAVPRRSVDDSDVGWGDAEPGSNDDRLSQDKPPHW
jgi:hypothetical protein